MLKRNKNQNSEIVVTDFGTRPLRDSEDNHILNNEETLTVLIDSLEKFEKETKSPAALEPAFREWLKECKAAVDSGESVVDYVNKTVARRINIMQAVRNANQKI